VTAASSDQLGRARAEIDVGVQWAGCVRARGIGCGPKNGCIAERPRSSQHFVYLLT